MHLCSGENDSDVTFQLAGKQLNREVLNCFFPFMWTYSAQTIHSNGSVLEGSMEYSAICKNWDGIVFLCFEFETQQRL